MATFHWRDILTITVNEMSRAAALEASQMLKVILESDLDDASIINGELAWMNVGLSPCIVIYKNAVLADGKHNIIAGDLTFDLELPLNRKNFESWPVSLTMLWVDASEKENIALSNHFLALLRRMPRQNGAQPSAAISS